MNYKLDIQEHEAEPLVAPRQETESVEEHQERLRLAQGKNVIRVAVLDDEASSDDTACTAVLFSPYYDRHSLQQRFNMIAKTMKQAGKMMVGREKLKETKPRLITLGE